jgi:hypothetical protein
VRGAAWKPWVCVVGLLLLGLGTPVLAHMTGISYADIEIHRRQISLRLRLNLGDLLFARKLDMNADLVLTREEVQMGFSRFLPQLLEQVRVEAEGEEGQGRLRAVNFWPERGEVECWLEYSFQRPLEEVSMKMALHQLTDSGHWNLAQIRYDGRQEQRYFNLENPQTRITLFRSGLSYIKLGWRFTSMALSRIVIHPDLLLFAAGLVLIGRSRQGFFLPPGCLLITQLSSFMVGAWTNPMLPPRFVSSALALSVIYIAAENLFIREVSHRSWIAGFFGLIYGFGFSSLIRDAGLPERGWGVALIGYQTGVVLSVVGTVILVFVMTSYFDRLRRQRLVVALASSCLMAFGIFEFVQRTF